MKKSSIKNVDSTTPKRVEHNLKSNEVTFKSLLEHSADVISILTVDGKFFYITASIKNILGYSEQEVMQMNLFSLSHPDTILSLTNLMHQVSITPNIPIGHTGKMRHKDGSWRWIESTFTNRLHDPSIQGIVDIFRDITEKKTGEEKIFIINRLYAFISQINQTIAYTRDEQTLFKEACRVAIEFGKFKAAWIGIFDVPNRKINFSEGFGLPIEDFSQINDVSYDRHEPQCHVLNTDTCYVCNNINQYLELNHWKILSSARRFGSCLVLPIRKSGKIIGTFNVYAAEVDFFQSHEIALLNEVTTDISFALDIFEKEKVRVLTEQRLSHHELRSVQAEAMAHFGSWELDLSSGLATWSDEALRIYGLPLEEKKIHHEMWLSLIHPQDLEYVKQITKEAESTLRNSAFFHRILRKDGTTRHIYSMAHLEFDHEGKPISMYGIAHDITEIKEAEEALRESERTMAEVVEFNQKLIDVSAMGIASYDATSGKCLSVNAAFAKIAGAKQEDVLRQNFRHIESWKKAGLLKDAEDTLLTGQVHYNESYAISSFNAEVWFDYRFVKFFHHSQAHLLILANDITDRKKAAIALQQSEFRYRQIVENAQEGIWMIDKNNKTIFVNRKMCEILEYTADEMLEKDNFYFVDEADREFAYSAIERRK